MKMECNSKFAAHILQYIFATVLCAMLFASPEATSADITPKNAIPLGKAVNITIGLPHNYAATYGNTPNRSSHCLDLFRSGTRLCARYVFGNDFQLLDWLENGRIDGAVVAPLALKILHTSDRQPFTQHFVIARHDAFTDHNLASYHLGLSAYENGALQSEPRERYHAYLEALLTDTSALADKIILDSHLSPALGLFLSATHDWLQGQSATDEQQEQFWKRLFKRMVFALSRPTTSDATTFAVRATENCDAPTTHCLSASAVHDYLLLRRQVAQETLPPEFDALPHDKPTLISDTYQHIVPDYLPMPPKGASLQAPLKAFIEHNYTPHQVGSQVRRYFRFTISELMHLLRPAADDGDKGDIALVLTGGGVKAAYQTRLVDYLYAKPYLTNIRGEQLASDTAAAAPLQVKYVIGTSGGALLGLFVAAINKTDNPHFSDLLWISDKTGKRITFTDVFPPIDMLRWLSFLFSLFIFTVIAMIILYRSQRVREHLGLDVSGTAAKPASDTGGRFFRFSIVWIAFLALTPFLILYVNGEQLEEHIPEMQGFFYFIFTLIAIYTDNHILRAKRLLLDENNVNKPGPAFLWSLLAGGVLLTVLPLAHRRWGIFDGLSEGIDATWEWLDYLLSWKMTTNVFMFCFGLLLLIWFIQRWYFYRSRGFRPLQASEGDVKGSYWVLILVPILSAAGIYILYKLDQVSAFELTVSFWVGLFFVAVVTSLLIFAYTLVEHKLGWKRNLVVPRLRFLMSRHPTTWDLQMSRLTRILMMFGLAWGWWNIVIGPGMYGNDNSQEYIDCLYDKVAGKQCGAASAPDTTPMQGFTLQTYFVAPATSLDTKSERYFLFEPHNGPANGDEGNMIDYRNQLAISSDPRWTQFSAEEQDKNTLTQIAFASGSPFPVFPAHKITIGNKKEKLIDGGYAHNTPIEAAKTLGADRLLVIYSSPLNIGSRDEPSLLRNAFGTMAENLPRLVPYLYERSQIEDILSAEKLLVAALSPTGGEDPGKWPLLTDFRQSVVDRMLTEAEQDLYKRIGTIQNWGLPDEVGEEGQ